MASILLLSDVDGTLLGADGRYAMTSQALAEAFAQSTARVDLVLASSRTVLELSRNQRDLGIEGAVVAENGAVVALPWDETLPAVGVREHIDGRLWCVIALGAPAEELRAELRHEAASLGIAYIDQEDVESSLGRRCSVLVRPAPGAPQSSLAPLVSALHARGRAVSSGGSWLAITGGADKGDGARELRAQLERRGVRYSLVAAVGDGDNDRSLLLMADRRFAIRHEDGSWHPALRALPEVECVPTPGIAGWRDVLRRLTALQEV